MCRFADEVQWIWCNGSILLKKNEYLPNKTVCISVLCKWTEKSVIVTSIDLKFLNENFIERDALVYKFITLQLVHRNIGSTFMLNMNIMYSVYGKSHLKWEKKNVVFFSFNLKAVAAAQHWIETNKEKRTIATMSSQAHEQ